MSLSVHDNYLVSYVVRCEAQEIRLHTEFQDRGEPFEYTDVLFTGVEAYHFENDNLTTILFNVSEQPIETIYDAWVVRFEAGKRYGWPHLNYTTRDDLLQQLRDRNVKGYMISSAFGMDGFVLAQSMVFVAVSSSQTDAGNIPSW